jgi:Ca-activated chloride channel homolog
MKWLVSHFGGAHAPWLLLAILLLLGVAYVVFRSAEHTAAAAVTRAKQAVRSPSAFEDAGKHAKAATAPSKARLTLYLLACICLAVAALRPQIKVGEKKLPATSLDVAIVLDVSKSMYATDVSPSRIRRAKLDIRELMNNLKGARFAAVAFAGETMTFPLGRDPSVVTQFLRSIEPNDMPVGGTAISKALDQARLLFLRDPTTKKHAKAIVLITDGEDLEGDPLRIAQNCANDGIALHVVHIGLKDPTPIPDVDENGRVIGTRRTERGATLMTSLSAEGEEQLRKIAELGGGLFVMSGTTSIGLDTVAKKLKADMKSETGERVAGVFEELFVWPLALAILLLVLGQLMEGSSRAEALAAGTQPESWYAQILWRLLPWRVPTSLRLGSPSTSTDDNEGSQ